MHRAPLIASPGIGSVAASRPTAWRRLARAAGPPLFYLLIGLGLLWPYRAAEFREAGDLNIVIAATVEAGQALKEGQFPIRVAPTQVGGMRCPFFQYYGNFPFTLTGLFDAAGLNPYAAWKLAALLTFLCGGYFTYRCANWISRQRGASVLAGAVFLTAPYLLTDLNARGAFAELVAFNLLPAVLYFTIRLFVSPRLRYVAMCPLAWTLLGLTHNITYFYAVLFVGLFVLSYASWGGRMWGRVGRLGIAAALHVLLIAWYVVPQIYTLNVLGINQRSADPYEAAVFTPLKILLAPVRANTAAAAATPDLGLQVGWPILASGILVLAVLILRKTPRRLRWGICRLLTMFGLALFMAWSPFDFWKSLPHVFWFVQFPYRMLMFVVLWGSMLTACALAAWFRDGLPRGTTWIVLALLGISAVSYVPGAAPLSPNLIREEIERPEFRGAVDDYRVATAAVARTSWLEVDPDSTDWKSVSARVRSQPVAFAPVQADVRPGATVRYTLRAKPPTLLALPVLYYPHLLDVRDNGHRVRYGNVGRFVALRLDGGKHRVSVRFVGVRWANVLSAAAWIGLLLMPAAAIVRRLRKMGRADKQAARKLGTTAATL